MQSIQVTPDSASLLSGGSVKLTAMALQNNGRLRDYSLLVQWTSLDTGVAIVEDSGLVHARGSGRTGVVASRGDRADTAIIVVGTGTVPTATGVSSVELAATGTLAVGASTTFPVTVYDLAGQVVASPVVAWSSSDAAVLTVDASGLATGRASGVAKLVASSGGKSDTMDVTVYTSTSDTPPPSDGVALTLRRFATGSGTVRVTGGIPLKAGQLRASDLSLVRVFVGGREVPIYVEALAALHPDGSLRSVYVELDADLSTTPVDALLSIGTPRSAGDLTRIDPATRGQPAAAILPSSADYLVATGIVGPTMTSAQTTALGGAFATWEANFAPYADKLWASEGSSYQGDYYDRAHAYFAAWVRSGNPEYFRRGAAIAVAYRQYVEANGYKPQAHWIQLDGLADHYLLTGDPATHYAVGRIGELMISYAQQWSGDTVNSDVRIEARTLTSLLLAEQLKAPGRTVAEWGSALDMALDKVLAVQQADGSFRYKVVCYESMNYQTGMLNDAFARVYDGHRADTRVLSAVKRSVDFLWNTQLVTSPVYTFKYLSGYCPNVGDTYGAPDLNGLEVTAFGWLSRRTGDATYRGYGDLIFAGINAAYLDGSKQFNQAYSQSYNFLGYR